jgi:predicted DNA-binding transcriptional regulator AlpA
VSKHQAATVPAAEPPATSIAPLAVDADGAAALCTVSVRHWLALHSSGRVPLPVRLGRSVRWRRDEIAEWLAAGCPNREAWLARNAN